MEDWGWWNIPINREGWEEETKFWRERKTIVQRANFNPCILLVINHVTLRLIDETIWSTIDLNSNHHQKKIAIDLWPCCSTRLQDLLWKPAQRRVDHTSRLENSSTSGDWQDHLFKIIKTYLVVINAANFSQLLILKASNCQRRPTSSRTTSGLVCHRRNSTGSFIQLSHV